jgi:MFS family permease
MARGARWPFAPVAVARGYVLLSGPRSDRARRTYRRYRDVRRSLRVPASRQSRYGLDWTNFFVSDMQTGFGSLVAFYLSQLGWSHEATGLALTVDSLASVLCQAPAGALADAVKWKRGLAAIGIVAVGVAALILALAPTPSMVYIAQATHGLAAGLTTAAIASVSLGLVGRATVSFRIGRNYRFSAAGNALTAGAMGAVGGLIATWAVFAAAAALSVPALIALFLIRPKEIDYARARNAGTGEAATKINRVLDLHKNRNLVVFAAAITLFQLADAAMLPAIGTHVAHSKVGSPLMLMSGLIVIPQILTALVAPWIGYYSERFGRKPLLLAGFGAQIFRALALAMSEGDWALLLSQVLDGISGATIGVLTLLTITDVTTGSGRFNLARGAVGTLSSLAASISTAASGFVIQEFGLSAGFVGMAAAAVGATLVTWMLLPETKPTQYLD